MKDNSLKTGKFQLKLFPVSLRNRLVSAGLKPVLSHTEKICIALYYILKNFPRILESKL